MDNDEFIDHFPDESIEETKQKVEEMMKDFKKQHEGKDIKIEFDETEYSDHEYNCESDSRLVISNKNQTTPV